MSIEAWACCGKEAIGNDCNDCVVYCNKCNKKYQEYNLNDLEAEELKKEGSFVCSECINNEMNSPTAEEFIINSDEEEIFNLVHKIIYRINLTRNPSYPEVKTEDTPMCADGEIIKAIRWVKNDLTNCKHSFIDKDNITNSKGVCRFCGVWEE